MGSGINTTFRQVGIATGVAGLGAVFQGQVDSKLSEQMSKVPAGLGEAVASGGSRAAAELGFHGKAVQAADVAFVSGLNEILVIGAIVCFVGAVLGFLLTRSEDFVQPTGG
jgi:predicted membrane-bound mannosyltransferase